MSGSSSSSRPSFSGGTIIDNPTIDCINFQHTTKVISPTMPYFGTAAVGDILKVKIDNSIVVLLDKTDTVVGSIYPTWIERLIKCLKDGYIYQAKIETINGTNIDILIKHV